MQVKTNIIDAHSPPFWLAIRSKDELRVSARYMYNRCAPYKEPKIMETLTIGKNIRKISLRRTLLNTYCRPCLSIAVKIP